eukprot:Opistho-2@89860
MQDSNMHYIAIQKYNTHIRRTNVHLLSAITDETNDESTEVARNKTRRVGDSAQPNCTHAHFATHHSASKQKTRNVNATNLANRRSRKRTVRTATQPRNHANLETQISPSNNTI